MKMVNQNEVSSQWLGACGLNPFHQHISSSRVQMFASHLGQMLVVKGATERSLQTGMEREYGKYTFKVEMPADGLILEIIERYPRNLGFDTINHNPQTTVVYEDVNTKEIGIINLTDYCSNHQYFGFRYTTKNGINHLHVGAEVPAGAVFLDSPSVTDDGGYKYGLEANVAFMTHPACAEDGVVVSDAFLKKIGFSTFETRAIDWGKKQYALNLYGDDTNYKPFPDIGDVVREDGVLMALRSYDPDELAIVEQSVAATQEIDYTFDTTVYAGGPGGRVIDIKIHHDLTDTNFAAVHMDGQAQKYDKARRVYYQKIMDSWKKLKRMRGDGLQITPEFHQLIVQAQSVLSEGGKQRVSKLYRKKPLDTYRVEFVIEYEIVPNRGFKLTDCFGGKGVICQINKEEDMPIDADGNRAEIIMDGIGTINRANPGRLFEQYYNAASRDLHKEICRTLNVQPFTRQSTAFNVITTTAKELVDHAFMRLYKYYQLTSPQMSGWFDNGQITATKEEYLAEIVEKGIGLFIPPDNQPVTQDVVVELEKYYRPCYGPVSYVGNSGKRVTTVNNVRIGSMYVILLEKIGDDWSGISSGKFQLFGVLSQLTRDDKYSKPSRAQAVRGAGEAENRSFVTYVGAWFFSEFMDRNNNPRTHTAMVDGILEADKPGNVKNLVDRRTIPYGGSKPLVLLKHTMQVGGIAFVYNKHKPNYGSNHSNYVYNAITTK